MVNKQNEMIRHPLKHRILHEIIMVAILLLVFTGFYIHRPFIGGAGFLMSMSRGVHYFAAIMLIVATVLRVWCMLVGTSRDCRLFIPTWADMKLLPKVINYYAYIGDQPVISRKYNTLQMLTYCFIFILVIFQILSGLALKYPDGFMYWFNYRLFDNEIEVRMAHFVVDWLFVIFLMIHVYLNLREKPSELKDMHLFSGSYKSEEATEKESV